MPKKPLTSGDFKKELEQQLIRKGFGIDSISDFRKELLSKRESHFNALFFHQLSLGVVDTIFDILDAADFYAGLKRIDIDDTPAVKMEGLIQILDLVRGNPRELARESRDSGIDNHLLPLALYALFALLERLCEGMKERVHGIDGDNLTGFFHQFRITGDGEIYSDESDADFRDFAISLDSISYDLKNFQTVLRLKEHEIYDQHPEWEVTDYIDGRDDPYDGREFRRNRSAALHAYYEQYGNPLEGFEEMANLLTCRYEFDKPTPAFPESDLRPFLATTKGVNLDGEVEESAPRDFSPQLKELFSTPISVEIALPDYACAQYGDNTTNLHLNPWIAAAKQKMCDAFDAYCRKRESELPDGIARELLKQKAADMISSRRDSITAANITATEIQVTPDQCPIEGSVFQEKLYCNRFKVSKDFKNVYDSVHTVDNYPLIQNLENAGNKVIEILKKLFNAYGKKKTGGWVYSEGGSWGPHFGKSPYSLFKNQQIAVRRNPKTNKSEWRIIPLAEFDEESPIGLHSKRKIHSYSKNIF